MQILEETIDILRLILRLSKSIGGAGRVIVIHVLKLCAI